MQILTWMTSPPSEHPWAFSTMTLVTLAFYFDLAWFREQFCSFLCPYARFQSVIMDRNTPVVAYDHARGEPRGKHAKGSCIDCGLCQRVCPTGIDIRNGLQLECINCNRCSDACDMIMTSLKRPKGLIRSASLSDLDGGVAVAIWQRPRLLLYGALMVLAFTIPSLYLGWLRSDMELNFSRQPGVAFSRLPDGRVANLFNMRSVNNSDAPMRLAFDIEPKGVEVICGSCGSPVPAHKSATHSLVVVIPDSLGSIKGVTLYLQNSDLTYFVPVILPSPAPRS